MNAKDQFKVVKKGFTIIRADIQKLQIKFKNSNHPEWTYYPDKYVSKAALERGMKYLLSLPLTVED